MWDKQSSFFSALHVKDKVDNIKKAYTSKSEITTRSL